MVRIVRSIANALYHIGKAFIGLSCRLNRWYMDHLKINEEEKDNGRGKDH